MPMLTDIASVKIGKQQADNTLNGLLAIRRTMSQPELSLKNKLKTTLTVGDASKIYKFKLPAASNGVYASWRSELEKAPVHDLYESQPLNKVKDNTKEDVQNMILVRRHNEWLKEVDERIRRLKIK